MSTNQIALFAAGGLPTVDMNAFKQSVKAASSALKQTMGGVPFLRMGKDGLWVYGADSTEVEEGSLWAINPFSMEMGYIAWGEEKSKDAGTVMGRSMALLTETPIQRGSLPDVGADWSPCVGFTLMCISGEDKGTLVKYETNSVGGRNAFADMLQLVSKAAEDGTGKVVPLVELDSDSYPHKKYGKIYTPIFGVKSWVMPDAKELGGNGGASPAKAEAAKAEPQQEEKAAAPQQEGAVRRRRR